MEYLSAKKFSFVSDALPSDTFAVVRFTGTEGISKLYRFEVTLISSDLEIDFSKVTNSTARLMLHREEGAGVYYNGIVCNFTQLDEMNGYAFYKAQLVPKAWWLSIAQHNQIFLDTTVPEFCEAVLVDGGLTSGADFEFRLMGTYEQVEYVCQFGENHLSFISRWFEREGIYFYFEQSATAEKIIITDTKVAHTDCPLGAEVTYSPPSGLESAHLGETVSSLHCRKNVLPKDVLLKDYNYRRPSLEIKGTADVDPKGKGTVYVYHDHFRTSEEGNRLAKIRAEGIICTSEEYYGNSSVPYLLPGFTFTLKQHYRAGFNAKYLVAGTIHRGDQAGYLLAGIMPFGDGQQPVYYTNRFTAIPADTQFRAPVKTHKPKVSGTLVGKIDGAMSGEYAELDEMGRYKVIMPFDLSGRTDGKASCWLRMAGPYNGGGYGMHFPLHKGNEVVLTFMNGDPDRPVIVGSVPNTENPSMVTSANHTSSVITTGGGNTIQMEDLDGQQRILLQSPTSNSSIRIGAAPSGGQGVSSSVGSTTSDSETGTLSEAGITYATNDWLEVQAGFKNEVIMGDSNITTLGAVIDLVVGLRTIISILGYDDITVGAKADLTFGGTWDVQLPETWVIKNKTTAVQRKESKVSEEIDLINNIHNEITNEINKTFMDRNEIGTAITKVYETESRLAQALTDTIQSLTNVGEDFTYIAEDHYELINQKIETFTDSVKQGASEVKTVENYDVSGTVGGLSFGLINLG